MALNEKSHYRIIKGINYFGLHQYFKNPSNVKYITLLRDPIERIINLYEGIYKNKNHSLHKTVSKSKMTLKDFVSSSLTKELSNYQTSLISGISFDLDKCNFNIYNTAIVNIKDHFCHVGIQAHLRKSVEELTTFIGTPKGIKLELQKKVQPKKQEISNEVIDLIHERNIYDIILFNKQLIKFREIAK